MPPRTWKDVEYVEAKLADARAEALRRTLSRSYANGRVLVSRLVPADPTAFDEAAHGDLRGPDHLLGTFLHATSVRAILGELNIDPSAALPPDRRVIGAFEFEGALIHRLVVGGAYGGGVPEEAARSLARDFVDACVEDRWLNVTVFAIPGAWTAWFYDVAWDLTFIVFDRRARTWTCLFATDTD